MDSLQTEIIPPRRQLTAACKDRPTPLLLALLGVTFDFGDHVQPKTLHDLVEIILYEFGVGSFKYLTAEEVSDRYRGSISVGTLRNWRAMRIGPNFVKIGKAVLYPLYEVDSWDQKNRKCRDAKGSVMPIDDRQ